MPACGRVIRKARERGIPVFFVNRIYRRNAVMWNLHAMTAGLAAIVTFAPNSTGALSIESCGIYTAEGDYTL